MWLRDNRATRSQSRLAKGSR